MTIHTITLGKLTVEIIELAKVRAAQMVKDNEHLCFLQLGQEANGVWLADDLSLLLGNEGEFVLGGKNFYLSLFKK
jgi:hypothetical protein